MPSTLMPEWKHSDLVYFLRSLLFMEPPVMWRGAASPPPTPLEHQTFPAPYGNRSASLENPDRQRKAAVILGAHRLFVLLWSRLFLKIDHLCCLLMPQSCKDLIFRPTNTKEEMEKQRSSSSPAPLKQRRLPVTRWLLVFNGISAICTGTSETRARKLALGADHKEKKHFGLNGMYCWTN